MEIEAELCDTRSGRNFNSMQKTLSLNYKCPFCRKFLISGYRARIHCLGNHPVEYQRQVQSYSSRSEWEEKCCKIDPNVENFQNFLSDVGDTPGSRIPCEFAATGSQGKIDCKILFYQKVFGLRFFEFFFAVEKNFLQKFSNFFCSWKIFWRFFLFEWKNGNRRFRQFQGSGSGFDSEKWDQQKPIVVKWFPCKSFRRHRNFEWNFG